MSQIVDTRPDPDARAREAIGQRWDRDQIPDLSGRRALVTGGTRGLGLAVATELARHGADVTITGRDARAAGHAAANATASVRTQAPTPGGRLSSGALDLTDLHAVAGFARGWDGPLDILVNNAGIMWGPFARTAAGVERQLATNFLGHFVLTGGLFGALTAAGARVVSLSSTYHSFGSLAQRDLDVDADGYRPTRAYGTSKLAMLAFARELDRRATAAGVPLVSVAAHPGWAKTDLQTLQLPSLQRAIIGALNRSLAVAVERGADPILAAATVPGLPGGTFVGPSRMGGYRGRPGVASSSREARDREAAARLWAWAERRSGVAYL